MKLRLIFKPPWSVLICRGDVIHAGAGGEAASMIPGGDRDDLQCICLHLYIGRHGVGLPDSINDLYAAGFSRETSDLKANVDSLMRYF